jgi:hypothetical protein
MGWVNFVSTTAREARSAQCALRLAPCAVRSVLCAHVQQSYMPIRLGCWRAPTGANSLEPVKTNFLAKFIVERQDPDTFEMFRLAT